MKKYNTLVLSALAAFTVFAGLPARADNMASIAITPATGVVTLSPQWSLGGSLAGFHLMSQDLSLGGGANQFYSIKSTTIPSGGDTAAFTLYIAGSGAATNHVDIGSKLTPDSYSALTSADPDVGYGAINFYFIHHKSTGDYFSDIVPGSATASSVNDLKPMDGPGGPSTLGASGYFGLTFCAANLGYGLNVFYYLRTDPVTGFTKFGSLVPALAGASTDLFDLGLGGHKALAFTGTDVGYGTSKMYYIRLDSVTGFTVLGTLDPGTGRTADIANLGSVYSTLTFVPGDVGYGVNQFYTAGTLNTTWQSVSFAAIADRTVISGSFTVTPSASSGLAIALTLVHGSATISAPVGGVFTVTPLAPGRITLQATQAGQTSPTPYEYNMLRQSFMATGGAPDFNNDGSSDILWRNSSTGEIGTWLMSGTTVSSYSYIGGVGSGWSINGTGDFNADGKSDILWRSDTTGEVGVWLMNGTTPTSYVSIRGATSSNWSICGTGDFNSDGKTDILWRDNTTGEVGTWLMNGTTVASYFHIGSVGTGWTIKGTGDFNNDGYTDILWQDSSTGEIGVWLMNGTTVSSYVRIGSVGSGWSINGTCDFNGDGKVDILWRNTTTGEVGVWLMNGTTVTGYTHIGDVGGTAWSIKN